MKCYICEEEKDSSQFHKDITKKKRLSSRCKECCKFYGKQYRIKHREYIKKWKHDWYIRKKHAEATK